MSFSVGIVGLPNVGKSTLFKALTKKPVDIAAYPFTTIHPNYGVVIVPDEKLEKIASVIKPEKTTPSIIEFVDIAGLVKGAHKGEGLGNQFLAHIRSCDAILEVVRAFEDKDKNVEHVTSEINPESDIETVKVELLMKDIETLENLIAKLGKEAKTKDKKTLRKLDLLNKLKDFVSRGKLISEIDLTEEEKESIKEHQFLTLKPIFYILNTNSGPKTLPEKYPSYLAMNLKEEEEISELTEGEIKELGIRSSLDPLILNCYNILDLITFYTVAGGKEVKAWTLPRGWKAPAAGGKVHSDFEERFIKADVINWEKLVTAGSWKSAREKGWIQTVGRDYVVQNGDVIEFKI